jgi:hypothetical protein
MVTFLLIGKNDNNNIPLTFWPFMLPVFKHKNSQFRKQYFVGLVFCLVLSKPSSCGLLLICNLSSGQWAHMNVKLTWSLRHKNGLIAWPKQWNQQQIRDHPYNRLPKTLVFLQILQHPSSFWMHQGSENDGRRASGERVPEPRFRV